jgi:hypothetical protein
MNATLTQDRQSAGSSRSAWRVRPFGQAAEDLTIAFDPWIQPRLVTDILARCVCPDDSVGETEIDPDRWTVNSRLQGLLAVAIATQGGQIGVVLRCPGPSCATEMTVNLDLSDFQNTTDRHEAVCRTDGGHTVRLRVPTGADQARWIKDSCAQVAPCSVAVMARDLVVEVDGAPPSNDWQVPEAWFETLEAALEQADPLTNLELRSCCPACGMDVAVPFDLEAMLLKLLAGQSARLLDDVHQLASAYHWSETAILSLTPHRRHEYLRRINATTP